MSFDVHASAHFFCISGAVLIQGIINPILYPINYCIRSCTTSSATKEKLSSQIVVLRSCTTSSATAAASSSPPYQTSPSFTLSQSPTTRAWSASASSTRSSLTLTRSWRRTASSALRRSSPPAPPIWRHQVRSVDRRRRMAASPRNNPHNSIYRRSTYLPIYLFIHPYIYIIPGKKSASWQLVAVVVGPKTKGRKIAKINPKSKEKFA